MAILGGEPERSRRDQDGRNVTETLAGRAGRLQLWPLSIGERLGKHENFLDQLLDDDRGWQAATAVESDRRPMSLRGFSKVGSPRSSAIS